MTDPTETTSDRLIRLGYGHRRDERTAIDRRREVYNLISKEVVGRFDAFEANRFCDNIEAKQ